MPAKTSLSHDVRPEGYSIGFLELSDVFYDCSHFGVADPLDRRHVSEPPVMGPNSVLGGKKESHIWMMSWVVNVIDQGWSVIRPATLCAVAWRAIGFEQNLAGDR